MPEEKKSLGFYPGGLVAGEYVVRMGKGGIEKRGAKPQYSKNTGAQAKHPPETMGNEWEGSRSQLVVGLTGEENQKRDRN